MDPTLVGSIVFACTFGGAFLGMWSRKYLPAGHLSEESRETVTLGVGLVATMTALVLGLVTASAKTSFDGVDGAVKAAALDVLTLDRLLARYGPETAGMRVDLQRALAYRIDTIWPQGGNRAADFQQAQGATDMETLVEHIRALAAHTESQQALRARALDVTEGLLRVRWLVSASTVSSVPLPFLSILLFWLTITFASFGLFAPRNGTVLVVLAVCALSVAGAVFLVLEMDAPFHGILKVSSAPLRYAYDRLNH